MLNVKTTYTINQELECINKYITEYMDNGLNNSAAREIVRTVMETRGKQIRPQLLLITGHFGPEYPACSDRLCKLGALIELIHMASLIHDDIVDDSPLRRGKPTVQARFGKDMAVYTGDLILSKVLCMLLQEDFRESGTLLGKTVEHMCQGEIGQFFCRYQETTTIQNYLDNIYGKTVSMFVSICKIGGIESGCNEETIDHLGQFGRWLGYVFQLRDDLLDFISDEKREGKLVHTDFQNGIYTLPILYALQQPAQSASLRGLIRRGNEGLLIRDDLAEMERLVQQAGGIRYTCSVLDANADRAEKALRSIPQSQLTESLIALVRWLAAVKFPINSDLIL